MSATFINGNNQPLDIADARTMIQKYHCHADKLETIIVDPATGARTERTLKGLVLDADDIDELHNMIHNDEVIRVLILFAVSRDDKGNTHSVNQSFTTIAAPVVLDPDNGEEIIDTNNLINRFKPCPDQCGSINGNHPEIARSYHNVFFGAEPVSDCRDKNDRAEAL